MKKILIISVSHFWYDSRVFFRVVKSILKKNNENSEIKVKLITQNQKDNNTIHTENFEKEIIDSKINKLLLLILFVAKGIIYKPDIVICIEPLTLISGILLKKKLNCRLIYDSHEFFAMAFAEKYKQTKSLYWFFEKALAKQTDAIITVNEELVNHLSKANSNTFLCANYPVKSLFLNEDNPVLTKKYDLIYAGGLCFERGLLQYLQAACYLKKANFNFTFAIIGVFFEKSTENFFHNYIKYHDLINNIKYIPYIPIEDVLLEIRQSKIGIFMGDINKRPRLDKTLNMKVLEYISQGVPVIVNESTVLKDFVNQSKCGWIIPYSSKELFYLLKRIINNEFDLDIIGAKARDYIYKKYTWENQEESLYEAIFGKDCES